MPYLPLDRTRRLRRHVIDHAADALDLVDDAGRGGSGSGLPQVRECSRRAARRTARDAAVPPSDVAPGAELEANFGIGPDMFKTHRLMEADAVRVGKGDSGESSMEALAPQHIQ